MVIRELTINGMRLVVSDFAPPNQVVVIEEREIPDMNGFTVAWIATNEEVRNEEITIEGEPTFLPWCGCEFCRRQRRGRPISEPEPITQKRIDAWLGEDREKSVMLEAIAAKGRRHLAEARDQWERIRPQILDCRPAPQRRAALRESGPIQYGRKMVLTGSPEASEVLRELRFGLHPMDLGPFLILRMAEAMFVVEDRPEAWMVYHVQRYQNGRPVQVDFEWGPCFVFHRNR